MKVRTVALLSFATLLLLVSGPVGATAPTPPVQWGYTLTSPAVPLGENVSVLLWGPYNGVVNVTLNVLPFNSTPPVYSQWYNLTTTVAPPPGTPVYRNITVPTAGLYVGTVRLCFTTGTGVVVGCPLLYLTSGNLTAFQNTLAWDSLNWSILNYREQSLFNAEQNLQGQIETQFWVSVVMWTLLIFTTVVTRTGVAERRIGKTVRNFFHGLLFRPSHIEFDDGFNRGRVRPPPANPERVFRGLAFPKCAICNIDHTEVDIVRHYRSDHGVNRPIRGRDYDIFRPAVRAAKAKQPDIEPSLAVLREHLDSLPDPNYSDLR